GRDGRGVPHQARRPGGLHPGRLRPRTGRHHRVRARARHQESAQGPGVGRLRRARGARTRVGPAAPGGDHPAGAGVARPGADLAQRGHAQRAGSRPLSVVRLRGLRARAPRTEACRSLRGRGAHGPGPRAAAKGRGMLTDAQVTDAQRRIFARIDQTAAEVGSRGFPHAADARSARWEVNPDGPGPGGFWVASCWLAYRLTGEPRYRAWGLEWAERLRGRERDLTHDIGFLFQYAAVLGWQTIREPALRDLA